ncbi:clarin-1 isoform X1 [Arapaima gigas]
MFTEFGRRKDGAVRCAGLSGSGCGSEDMSNRQKKALFCACGALSFACVLCAAVAVGTPQWVRGTILCHTGAQLVNATDSELDQFVGRVSYGLFHGQRLRQCGLGGRPLRFSCE